jgi:hypothetical protein
VLHLPHRGKRCEHCEAYYQEKKDRIHYRLLMLIASLPALFLAFVALPKIFHRVYGDSMAAWNAMAMLLLLLVVLPLLSILIVVGLRVWLGRVWFMSQRPRSLRRALRSYFFTKPIEREL